MASKYEIITALYRESVKGLAKNHHTWTAFLHSACYNYRLPFDEQVLIHAQRPDATAVLEIEGKNGWNQKFGRWVNRYATGIAVFDRHHAGRQRLKYYFDISDTHESRFARPVPIWEYKPEYEAAVIEALENRFGELRDKSDLQSALHSVAKNAVEDNLPDYLSELIRYRADSFLEDYDDLNVEVIYRRLLENSVAYRRTMINGKSILDVIWFGNMWFGCIHRIDCIYFYYYCQKFVKQKILHRYFSSSDIYYIYQRIPFYPMYQRL